MKNDLAHAVQEPGVMSPDVTMLILTWFAFISLLLILHKFAWKPILAALDAREQNIRKSVEDAEKIKVELAKISEQQNQILLAADLKAKEIIDKSKNAASEAARSIQDKAREESKILIDNATREIKQAKENAQAQLREESAKIAIELASKIIEENLNDEKNRKLVDKLINKL